MEESKSTGREITFEWSKLKYGWEMTKAWTKEPIPEGKTREEVFEAVKQEMSELLKREAPEIAVKEVVMSGGPTGKTCYICKTLNPNPKVIDGKFGKYWKCSCGKANKVFD